MGGALAQELTFEKVRTRHVTPFSSNSRERVYLFFGNLETPKPITVALLLWDAYLPNQVCLARGYLNTHSTLQFPTSTKLSRQGTIQRGWIAVQHTNCLYLSIFLTGRLYRSRIPSRRAAAYISRAHTLVHQPAIKSNFAR